jgi:hypothetical protein
VGGGRQLRWMDRNGCVLYYYIVWLCFDAFATFAEGLGVCVDVLSFHGLLLQSAFVPLGKFREVVHPGGEVTSTLLHHVHHTK